MANPAVTREYTHSSCCSTRNPMRHPPWREMRAKTPALGAEQFRVSNQTPKEPQGACWNTRDSPRPLSQDERNTAVTSGIQNSSVYPKPIRDEVHFPFIGSIDIPYSTSYRTNGLPSFRTLQRFPETQFSSLYEYLIQESKSRKAPCIQYGPKMRAESLSLSEEVSQLSRNNSTSFPSAVGM